MHARAHPAGPDRAHDPRARLGVAAGIPPLIACYLLVFLIPIELSFYIGSLLITPTRAFLLITAVPVIILALSRRQMRSEDVMFILFVGWVTLAYLIKRKLGAVEIIGQHFLEAMVSFLVARTFLVGLSDFQSLIRWLVVIVVTLGIFAIPEGILHFRFFHDVPALITGFDYEISDDTRLGLLRAASTFEHPILYGLFCAAMFSLMWYATTDTPTRIWRMATTGVATFFSLSSAAFLVLGMQFMLIAAERYTRKIPRRLMWFTLAFVAVVLVLELASNRGSIRLLSTYLTFNPHTGYYRLLQWDFSIDDVMRHPFVGINFENWTRPHWLTDSIDNHWLFTAMSSGLPALAALWSVMAIISVKLYRKMGTTQNNDLRRLCLAWLIGILALFMGGWTVTFFGKMLPIFMFYLGIGSALSRVEAPADDATPVVPPATRDLAIHYSRFAPKDAP